MQAEFVNGVVAAGFEHSDGLVDDGLLAARRLHREHRLADHHVGAPAGQAGVGRVCGDDAAPLADHQGRGGRVGVNPHVAGGSGGQNQGGRAADAGREFDHLGTRQVRLVEQLGGEFETTGTQHPLAESGQQPVALNVVDGTVGLRQRAHPCLLGG